MRRDKPARCEGVKVSESEGLVNHTGPESCAGLGNNVSEALTGKREGRVLTCYGTHILFFLRKVDHALAMPIKRWSLPERM